MLQDELAELVALERVGNNFQMTPSKIITHYWLNHILGCSPSMVTDTLEWLQDPQGTAVCFPANIIGPDLIFVLRLTSDNMVLRMCVQFKHMEKMSPKDWRKAICTTNPSTFLSENTKDTNSPTCSNPSMWDRMVEAINNLGNRTKKTEPCGLLQVVFSHPSLPDRNTLEEAANGNHPLATVLLNSLDLTNFDDILSCTNLELWRPNRKRKSSDEIEGARCKKRN